MPFCNATIRETPVRTREEGGSHYAIDANNELNAARDSAASSAFPALPARERSSFVAAATFILVCSSLGQVANAQQVTTPMPQAAIGHGQALEAPVGHRQPRARDLPPNVLKNEGARTERQKEFDKTLNSICRC